MNTEIFGNTVGHKFDVAGEHPRHRQMVDTWHTKCDGSRNGVTDVEEQLGKLYLNRDSNPGSLE